MEEAKGLIIYKFLKKKIVTFNNTFKKNGENMSCDHKMCGNIQKVWLPFEVRGHMKGLKSHPYCLNCGAIKNISSDRAKKIGYFMNILSRFPITKVQGRLIAKDMEEFGGFEDSFSISSFIQEQIFINIVKKYSSLSEHTIKGALECRF